MKSQISNLKSQMAALLLCAAVAVCFLSPRAEAQSFTAYAAQTLVAGGTNNIAPSGSNVYNAIMTLTRQREVAVHVQFNAIGTNTSTILFHVNPSVDSNLGWDLANDEYNFGVAANGTNTVNFVTNLVAPGAIGYLRLQAGVNPNTATAITNLTVKYAIKR